MACFTVSAVEAIAVTVAKKVVEKKELEATTTNEISEESSVHHTPLSTKLGWLTKMLWGGVFLLLIEHMWHGEVVPYFPFLTAMSSKEATMEMLHEMATVGVSMAILVTAFWGLIVLAHSVVEKKKNLEAKREA
ncbi:MAG: hypothetical protein K5656_11905 [Lachnospiraceae bacterium]|nr:hypothetical protein [Lachnospiraceae bacterium]